MQLVDRKILEDLLKSSGEVTEAEKKFSYREFVDEHMLELEAAKRAVAYHDDDIVEMAFTRLERGWIKANCPPIKYIADGSSRAAYACSGGKCLKVAKKLKGIAQNRQEVKNAGIGKNKKYSCFTTNYAYDSIVYGSLLTECCSKFTSEDLKKLYGMRYGGEQLYELFLTLRDNSFDLKQAAEEQAIKLKEMKAEVNRGKGEYEVYDVEKVGNVVGILEAMLKSNEPKYKVLKDLNQFYFDHGQSDDELLIDDLAALENWGLAIRERQLVPVLLDSGFSDQIYNDYYNRH